MPTELHLQLESLLYSTTGIGNFSVPSTSSVVPSSTTATKNVVVPKPKDTVHSKDNHGTHLPKGNKKDSVNTTKDLDSSPSEAKGSSGINKKNNNTNTSTIHNEVSSSTTRGGGGSTSSTGSAVDNDHQLRELRTELESFQQQLVASQKERESLVNEVQTLKSSLATVTKTHESYVHTEKNATARVEQELRSSKKNDEVNQTTIKQLTHRVKELEDLLEKQNKDTVFTTLRKDIDTLNETNEKLRKTIGNLEKTVNNKKKEINNLNTDRTKIRREVQDMEAKSRTEANEWLKQFHLLEMERDNYKDKFFSEKQRAETVPNLQKTVEELKHTISNHKTVLDQATNGEQRYKSLYEKTGKELETVQTAFSKYKHDYSGTFQQYETLKVQVTKLEQQRQNLSNENTVLKEKLNRNTDGTLSTDTLEQTNKALQKSLENSEKEIKDMRNQIQSFVTKNKEMKTLIDQYSKETKTYQEEISTLRKQVIVNDTKYIQIMVAALLCLCGFWGIYGFTNRK